ncbi:MAG TPA: carboxypeptidase regulatory-like domain-containing protein, partial [Pyrinomonadaceae bacterium]
MRTTRLSLVVFCLLIASPVYSQSNYASLSGTVFDPQQKVLAGSSVQVTSENTGASRSAVTNELGSFQITGLLPGDYKISVQASGFATLTQKITLEVGQSMTLDLNLKVATLNTVVEVNADTINVLRTTDASVGEVVEPTAVQNLPLNGRMLIDLVLTVPGAHEGHGAQTGDMSPLYWRPGQRSAISISGNRPNANYFLLDGATNTDPTFNTLNFSPSPDAVQEFKVQTGSYTAELGGAGGGQVNIVTRTGSNEFHGTVYEFLRNDVFDARTFNEMDESNHLVRNNFGGSFGGPIVRNKSFFFVNYEGLRHTRSQTMVSTVPTLDEINGDFTMSGATIYNPFSSHANPNFDPTKP